MHDSGIYSHMVVSKIGMSEGVRKKVGEKKGGGHRD